MTNKVYDSIKDLSLLWMPAGITLFGVIWTAWGLPCGKPILTTLVGVNTFLGAVVKYYKSRYDKAQNEDTSGENTNDKN